MSNFSIRSRKYCGYRPGGMEIRERFCFNKPEDNHWSGKGDNEKSQPTKEHIEEPNRISPGSFFDDLDDTFKKSYDAESARAALNELFLIDTDAFTTKANNYLSEIDSKLVEASNASADNDNISVIDHQSVFGDSELSSNLNQHTNNHSNYKGNETTVKSAIRYSTPSISSFSGADSSQLDYRRLQAEHRKLQHYLEIVRNERFVALPVKDIVIRLIKRESVPLDLLRTKQEKIDLIDYAIQYGYDDVIVRVLLFLKASLKSALFREILLLKPEAAKAYVEYLYQVNDFEELTTTLYSLGRGNEAAMVELHQASKKRTPEEKVVALKKTLISGFSDPTLADSKAIISEYINLMERQMVIEESDSVIIANSADILFKEYPKKTTLIGKSLYTTVYYCSLYHYRLPENTYASPLSLKIAFKLSEREYSYQAISTLAKRGCWVEIDKLITNKNFLGISKVSCAFGWKHFFNILIKYKIPPPEYLEKWLLAIENIDERIKLANLPKIRTTINLSVVSSAEGTNSRDKQISGMFAKINQQVEVKKISAAIKKSNLFSRK
uniref:Vps16_C domain-containing protein n=1 Tax=Rhabditophanes sp. KR3021 TaxID=114890 RepID=A0AC35UGT3_9BILA